MNIKDFQTTRKQDGLFWAIIAAAIDFNTNTTQIIELRATKNRALKKHRGVTFTYRAFIEHAQQRCYDVRMLFLIESFVICFAVKNGLSKANSAMEHTGGKLTKHDVWADKQFNVDDFMKYTYQQSLKHIKANYILGDDYMLVYDYALDAIDGLANSLAINQKPMPGMAHNV